MKNWNNGKKDKKIRGKTIGSENFTGKINLRIESAEDHTQVNDFCVYLKEIKNLKISSFNWSESKGLMITISLKDTIPLGDRLRQVPLVEEVYKIKKDITVVLDTAFPATDTPVVSGDEGVATA
ncbi:MAG TPA: hypothetical protein G4O16_09940 [Dehalococcoidia bacterium]|nr:hypothetical protein [Dehalococcoidia bacterium]